MTISTESFGEQRIESEVKLIGVRCFVEPDILVRQRRSQGRLGCRGTANDRGRR